MAKVLPIVSARSTLILLSALSLVACDGIQLGGDPTGGETPVEPPPAPVEPPAAEPEPEPEPEPVLADPVPLWREGQEQGPVDAARAEEEGYLILDLGEAWTPYLFTESSPGDAARIPNQYRETYLALARGEFPNDHHGRRAERDQYLELYGIPPTLALTRTRFNDTDARDCVDELDLQPLRDFEGFVRYQSNQRARRDHRRWRRLTRQVEQLVERQGVNDQTELDLEAMRERDAAAVRQFREKLPEVRAIETAQARMECEGFFEGRGRYLSGVLDWATHEALSEFERRHRVFGWGFVGRDTLPVLREDPRETERQDVLRVLTERAMHDAGVIEDGSRSMRGDEPRTYRGADGEQHPIRNLEEELRQRIIESFGLQTPESTLAFLEGLDLQEGEHLRVAVPAVELPEYYSDDMELSYVIDRGDVWYEFPYDAEGNERGQPTSRRPRATIFVEYLGQRIPLARFGTTIGGWRSEYVDGTIMWKYKGSEVGPRVWQRIAAAPVWLPPETTPPRSLLVRGRDGLEPNYHETGPSYASAYGLVAAYHQLYRVDSEGNIRLGGDEGIRSHGSVDYMSIMRRHSHGCHRLHNHIAVRLMSFVLNHRPHRRVGMQQLAFRRELEVEDETYNLEIDNGGYIYELEEPLRVNVLEGRIRGARRTPIEHPIPKYDRERGGYIQPDGQWITVDRMGNITPIDPPPPVCTAEDGTETPCPEGSCVEGQCVAAPVEPETVAQAEPAPTNTVTNVITPIAN